MPDKVDTVDLNIFPIEYKDIILGQTWLYNSNLTLEGRTGLL
jgi:hypothetical protein